MQSYNRTITIFDQQNQTDDWNALVERNISDEKRTPTLQDFDKEYLASARLQYIKDHENRTKVMHLHKYVTTMITATIKIITS